jgi:two-component system, NarL family, sensor kinase
VRTLAAAAAAVTVLGAALVVAADGLRGRSVWGLLTPAIVALVLVGLGAPLARRPQGRRIGLLLLGCGTTMAASIALGAHSVLGRARGWPAAEAAGWAADRWLWALAVVPISTVLLATFPDGRAVSPRWRPVVWLGWGATGVIAVGSAVGSEAVAAGVGSPLWTAAGLAGLTALVQRWRRSDGVARQQVKYLLLAALVVVLIYAVADLLPYHARQAALLAVPLVLIGAVALAVLRYRLYDIDVVIRRATVFVGVTGLVFLAYVGGAAAFGGDASERAALVTAVVVAVVAEPVRRWVGRATGRLLFGRRDDPLAALAVLRNRLRDAGDRAELADVVAEVVPRLLRTRTAELRLLDGAGAVERRTSDDETADIPLVHQSELLGSLVVALREPGVPFGRADTVLLTELAHQVAAAAHAVRLTEELRAAADSTARAAAREREELRRDLHDRLGPLLVGTGLTVDGMRRAAGPDGAMADALAEITQQLRSASGEVRRIVDRLAPAAPLDLGLPEAVQAHLDRLSRLPGIPAFGLSVTGSGPLPGAVQEAAYVVLLEAVTNALRHARARRVSVVITQADGALHLGVEDDGTGLAEPWTAGVGVGSMRRRVLELGGTFDLGPGARGGTLVRASIPLEESWSTRPTPSESSSPTTTPSSDSACDGSSTPSPDSTSSQRPPTRTPSSALATSSVPTSS